MKFKRFLIFVLFAWAVLFLPAGCSGSGVPSNVGSAPDNASPWAGGTDESPPADVLVLWGAWIVPINANPKLRAFDHICHNTRPGAHINFTPANITWNGKTLHALRIFCVLKVTKI